MFEVRIHSRGGQGGVTAARLLATAALHDGKYATACPFYGAERRGAPVVSFVRIDDHPIKVYSQIRDPDRGGPRRKCYGNGRCPEWFKKGWPGFDQQRTYAGISRYATFSVDLTGIALREKLVVAGSPILNTPVLGALAKMGIISAEAAKAAIRGMFTDERNVKAAEAAYKEMSA